MVSLTLVHASNGRAATELPAGLVAVFAGATAGIGEFSLKAFAKHTTRPRIYFIGRSEQSAARVERELKELNAGGEYIFLKGDFSLLKNVDAVCEEIKAREKSINVLFLSQGTLSMRGDTTEGLPYLMAVSFYSRMRLTANLLPLMEHASSPRRVVSVMAGGREGKVYADDIAGRKVPIRGGRGHICSAMTVSLLALASRHPRVSLVHDYPGLVRTNLIRRDDGLVTRLLGVAFALNRRRHMYVEPDEVGERHAFLCLSGMYPPRGDADGGDGGVVLGVGIGDDDDWLQVARGVDGVVGSGVYSVDEFGDAVPGVVETLRGYREEGVVEKIWGHVEGEFERICGSEVV